LEIAEQAKIEASEARQTGEMGARKPSCLKPIGNRSASNKSSTICWHRPAPAIEQARLELAQLEAVGRALEADEEGGNHCPLLLH
jgi:hypothetical protein